jgi:hypothetical protein
MSRSFTKKSNVESSQHDVWSRHSDTRRMWIQSPEGSKQYRARLRQRYRHTGGDVSSYPIQIS